MAQPYSFQELFLEQINDLFSGEEQINAVMTKLIYVTSSGDLRETFNLYAQATQNHAENLKEILMESQLRPTGKVCKAIEGMIEEMESILQHGGNSAVKDAALIAAMQRVMHYMIATYGTARTFARHLNDTRAVEFLQKALNEEAEGDRKLTKLAEGGIFTNGINQEAVKEVPLAQV